MGRIRLNTFKTKQDAESYLQGYLEGINRNQILEKFETEEASKIYIDGYLDGLNTKTSFINKSDYVICNYPDRPFSLKPRIRGNKNVCNKEKVW